jgi:dolichol-phosphate mannosyltransferase
MQISVVIPAYNEEGNIGPLVTETIEVIPVDMLGEIVVADDCSTDTTRDVVLELARANPKIRLIKHEQNAGQSAALRSGVLAAKFPIIATMDGDGQNVPENIPDMVAMIEIETGPHLIGGVRAKRKDTLSKRWASKSANAIRRFVLRDDCPDTGCGIKVFSRAIFVKLPFFSGLHRYLPALFAANGYTCAYMDVKDRPRLTGQSKYTNFGRAMIGIYDLIGVGWLIRRSRNPGVKDMTDA